jgi:toxin ParE1/3/4
MYKLSAAAAKDIELLLDQSVVQFGIQRTQIYFESLEHCLELLGENPQLGSAADDIRESYRRFPHESHVIFYSVRQDEVFIVRILHKHMDALRHLQE